MVTFINIAYIVSAILFIFGIKMLGKAETARRGNQISAIGMLVAVVVTLLPENDFIKVDYHWIALGLVAGAVIGAVLAKRVQMTGMPELVALFNGFGGLASLVVAWAGYQEFKTLPGEVAVSSILAVIIGGITFTGSIIAFLKLSGKMGGKPTIFPNQKLINLAIAGGLLIFAILFCFISGGVSGYIFFILVIVIALALGVAGVLPIGGGDMPVVIALLNSFSGLAASAAGFAIGNKVLIVAGCLVGASGLILTIIMCKAMNRTLGNVLFGGFGATVESGGGEVEGEMKAASIEDAYYVLEAANSVVIVPGYGMAVAQAQHAVKELASLLEDNGAEVTFAIHPVAGRMPGHMNVLLAEADVPYEQLSEMDDVNPNMPSVDVAIVIGANDVVNPAAGEDPSSPIYGMPIINVHQAKTVYALKRGQGAGFSGLVNKLFFRPNTRMLYGDAKQTVSELVGQFKDG